MIQTIITKEVSTLTPEAFEQWLNQWSTGTNHLARALLRRVILDKPFNYPPDRIANWIEAGAPRFQVDYSRLVRQGGFPPANGSYMLPDIEGQWVETGIWVNAYCTEVPGLERADVIHLTAPAFIYWLRSDGGYDCVLEQLCAEAIGHNL